MDSDLLLSVGLVMLVFSVPACMAALTYERSLRSPGLVTVLAGLLILVAFVAKPGGYRLVQVPEAFFAVIGRVIH